MQFMDYYRFIIKVPAGAAEMALAFLSQLPFDTFEETEEGLDAYLRQDAWGPELASRLNGVAHQLGLSYQRQMVPHQNWNERWEAEFQPIRVGTFCGVRATFHPSLAEVAYEIIIEPEMAFGTGHHATTHLMMAAMQNESVADKAVLDYGCGTGILAILAAKMGAGSVDAVDIEAPAYESTLANAARNGAEGINAYLGTLDAVPDRLCDLILANINRNVILSSLPALYNRLEAGGVLLVSGILLADQSQVAESARRAGLSPGGAQQRADWCCLRFTK